MQQQLEQWAYYPDDLQSKAPPDIIEDLYIDKVPQKLYDILVPYDRQTILLTPSIGSDLQNFKNLYYISRKNEIIFEQKVFVRAGTLVSSRPADAWRECVRYFILRSTNHSQEQLKLEPQFLFYINFDEAEKAYLQLSVDKTISAELQAMARDHGTIRQASSDIAQRIRASSATPSKN